MYVSLRDQQQTNSDSSPCNHLMTLRFQLVKQPSISGPSSAKLGLAKPRSTIQFKHSRKQIRPKFVSANTIFPKTRNASESSPNKEVLKCDSNSNKTNVSGCCMCHMFQPGCVSMQVAFKFWYFSTD